MSASYLIESVLAAAGMTAFAWLLRLLAVWAGNHPRDP